MSGVDLGPEEYERAARAAVLGPAMAYIQDELKGMEEAVLSRALSYGAGLSPDMAIAALSELRVIRDLGKRLKKRTTLATEVHNG